MLEEVLRELEEVWSAKAAPLHACLAPGLPRASADRLAAAYGLTLPDEAACFFGWHDGLRADREQEMEIFPALRPVSLEESLQLEAALREAFTILPQQDPLLAGRWLPLLSDDAGNFWFVSADPGAERRVYALELEDPTRPDVRFDSIAAMASALTELFRSGVYCLADGRVRVADARKEESIIAAHNRQGDAPPGPAATAAADVELVATLAALGGKSRALRILDAIDRVGAQGVSAAIDELPPGDREEIARSLGTTGDSGAAPVLRHLLADAVEMVRETAAGAIGFSGDAAAANDLVPLLASSNHTLRKAAAFSLGELGSVAAAASLLPLAGDPHPAVRAATATALGKLGARVDIEPLLRLLDDPYADAAQMAAWALGEIGDPAAAASLEKAAKSADPTLARLAGASLRKVRRNR